MRCGRSSRYGGYTRGSGPIRPGNARRAASAAPRCRGRHCAAAAPPPPAAMGGNAGSGGEGSGPASRAASELSEAPGQAGGGRAGRRRGAARRGDVRHGWVWRRSDIECAGGVGGCRARRAQGHEASGLQHGRSWRYCVGGAGAGGAKGPSTRAVDRAGTAGCAGGAGSASRMIEPLCLKICQDEAKVSKTKCTRQSKTPEK